MSRITYVGGFGSGERAIGKVAEALEKYYEEIDAFSLSDYVRFPDKIRSAAKGVTLLTHSAGALSLPTVESDEAYLLNPPIPRHIGGLMIRSVIKSGRLYAPRLGSPYTQSLRMAIELSKDFDKEIKRNLKANFSQLSSISRYNAVDAAIEAKGRGVQPNLIWTSQDFFFEPSKDDIAKAAMNAVPMTTLEGQHDEVFLHPEEFLDQVFNRTSE